MKKRIPYAFHKWSVYTKEWFSENIQNIPNKFDLIKTNFPRILICRGVDKKRTRKSLNDSFKNKGIPFGAYCLTGGKPENMLVLCRFGLFFWQCYYVERGVKWDIRLFPTQNQACFYLYYSVLNDFKDRVALTKIEKDVVKNFKYGSKYLMRNENML